MPKKSFSIIAAALLVFSLTGCSGSSAGTMTCEEYGELPMAEKTEVKTDLLVEHDLVVADPENLQGVSDAVDRFCGTGVGKATKNLDRPLSEAANWKSKTW